MSTCDTTYYERYLLNEMMNDIESVPHLQDVVKDKDMTTESRSFILEKINEAYTISQSLISAQALSHYVRNKFDSEFEDKKINEHELEIDIISSFQRKENLDFIVSEFKKAQSINNLSNILEASYLDLEKCELKSAYKKVLEHLENPASFAHQEIPPITDFMDSFIGSLGNGSRQLTGLETGFTPYDEQLSGINGLTVLGGSPGAGKTALVSQLSCGCAEHGIPVLFYSLEMARNEIIGRSLCRYSEVELDEIILDGRLYLDANCQSLKRPDAGTNAKIQTGLKSLQNIADRYSVFTLEDERQMDFDVVKSDIIRTKEKYNTEDVLVIIDHLQIFPVTDKFGNIIDKENHLITGFKRIHTQTHVPIILLSQQNKVGVSSNNPNLVQIKGSVSNIYTPDVVLTIIDPNQGTQTALTGDYKPVNLHVIKNRNGRTDFYIPLDFQPKYFQFTERKDDDGGND